MDAARRVTQTGRPIWRLAALSLAISGAAAIAPSWLVRPAGAALIAIANPDTHTMKHDTTATVPAPGVLGNDLNIGGSSAILTAQPTKGTVNLASNGGYTYKPNAGYVGTDVFRYRPSGLLGTGTTVTITITNAAPVAVNNSYTIVTAQTLSVAAPGVLANDTDADGDALTAQLVDGSGNGSLSLNSNGSFTFTSGGSFTGLRTFTYRVSDGITSSGVATVSIQVSAPAPTPTPTPAPTPTPTPAPTPPPAPTPTPTAAPTPPLPTLPLPTIPVPTAPPLPTLPPVPTIAPTSRPTVTPTAAPSATPGSIASPGRSPDPSALPGSSAAPSLDPGATPGASDAPDASGVPAAPSTVGNGNGGSGGAPGAPRRADFTVGGGDVAPFDLGDVGIDGFGDIEWAVPALAMTVPGLLLMLAVLAQLSAGAIWLPIVKRGLGGFGVARRRRRAASAS